MDMKLFMYIFDTNDLKKPDSIFHVFAFNELEAMNRILEQSEQTKIFFKEFLFDDFHFFQVLSHLEGKQKTDEEIANIINDLFEQSVEEFYPFYQQYIMELPLQDEQKEKLIQYIPVLVKYIAFFTDKGVITREELVKYPLPTELIALDAILETKKEGTYGVMLDEVTPIYA